MDIISHGAEESGHLAVVVCREEKSSAVGGDKKIRKRKIPVSNMGRTGRKIAVGIKFYRGFFRQNHFFCEVQGNI